MRRIDPYSPGLAAATLALFLGGTWHFREALQTEWLTVAYFVVVSTLTTAGYGDITPHRHDLFDVLLAITLMLSVTVITGSLSPWPRRA